MGAKMIGSETKGEVFIVDDDPTVRDLLSEVLSQAGYRAISFVDGASFIIAARERIPACVILDIYMPGRSGLEILKDIDAPNYPIFRVRSKRSRTARSISSRSAWTRNPW
jgi:FixJ family two-component response regulator